MKKLLTVLAMLACQLAFGQSLNWNTVTYTTGNLSPNFGSIGTPASNVSLNITGNTARIDAGFPIKYTANPSGSANDCAVNCALRSSVTFATLSETIIYTFSFSGAVSGLNFRIYDIDGVNASSGDQATVTALNGSTGLTVTMTTSSGPTITGSGTTSATAQGTQGNTTDDFVNVSVTGNVTSLTVTYANNPSNPSAGNRSFSIGNLTWSGVLPVSWLSFNGQLLSNGTVGLTWKTANEVTASKYVVEKSKDGRQFTAFTEKTAAGGALANEYSATDLNPGPGNTLYRIREVDQDGRFSYSSIVLIQAKNKGIVTLFPNPATDYLTISFRGNAQLKRVRIWDAGGRLLLDRSNLAGKLDLQGFEPGVYLLQAENNSGERYQDRFVKQ